MLRQITDELMFEIRELTGQSYRNEYASKKAETEPTIPATVGHMSEVLQPSGRLPWLRQLRITSRRREHRR